MDDIISDEFPTLRPVLIRIDQETEGSQINVRIVEGVGKIQTLTFDDYGTQEEKKTIVKRTDPATEVVLHCEIYHTDLVKSMIQFLEDQQFGDPRDDTKLEFTMPSIPMKLFKIPFIQQTNCYKFWFIQNDEHFINFFEQVDPTKEIHITTFPTDMMNTFLSSSAFIKLKCIHFRTIIKISPEMFVASQAENISFRIMSKDFDNHINLKLKKWLGDVAVEYKTIRIEDIRVNWDNVLKDIPLVGRVENNNKTEYVIQRSDGTVGRLWCKENMFQFVNEGKTDMKKVMNMNQIETDVILPMHIFYKIAIYFDMKTQRRFAQTCHKANEIARKTNRVWPYFVELNSFKMAVTYDDDSKLEEKRLYRNTKGECILQSCSKTTYSTRNLKDIGPEVNLPAMVRGFLTERLKYLENDQPHHTTLLLVGEEWPSKMFDLKYFQTANRYEISRELTLSPHFVPFLENVDAEREIVITRHQWKGISFDEQFFETCKRLKHLELENVCQISNAQFLNSEAEVLQIVVESILDTAVNRKMKKWLNGEQNFKFFGIIFDRLNADFSIDEALNGVEHVEIPQDNRFREVFKGFKLKRSDGKEAELFISKIRIVFKTCKLPVTPISLYNYHSIFDYYFYQ